MTKVKLSTASGLVHPTAVEGWTSHPQVWVRGADWVAVAMQSGRSLALGSSYGGLLGLLVPHSMRLSWCCIGSRWTRGEVGILISYVRLSPSHQTSPVWQSQYGAKNKYESNWIFFWWPPIICIYPKPIRNCLIFSTQIFFDFFLVDPQSKKFSKKTWQELNPLMFNELQIILTFFPIVNNCPQPNGSNGYILQDSQKTRK